MPLFRDSPKRKRSWRARDSQARSTRSRRQIRRFYASREGCRTSGQYRDRKPGVVERPSRMVGCVLVRASGRLATASAGGRALLPYRVAPQRALRSLLMQHGRRAGPTRLESHKRENPRRQAFAGLSVKPPIAVDLFASNNHGRVCEPSGRCQNIDTTILLQLRPAFPKVEEMPCLTLPRLWTKLPQPLPPPSIFRVFYAAGKSANSRV